jgi:16S rRNA processing protein RimM
MPRPSDGSTDAPGAEATPDVADVDAAALVQVGFVYRPHGVQGELKIDPAPTDDPTRFERFGTVYVGARPQQVVAYPVASVRYQETKRGTTVILGLDGIETRTDAEGITKDDVFVHEEALDLGDDEVFVHDLIGAEVVTEDGETVGTVGNIVEMPAHETIVVTRPGRPEAMVPAVEDFVLEIDPEAGRVVVRPIDGLFD